MNLKYTQAVYLSLILLSLPSLSLLNFELLNYPLNGFVLFIPFLFIYASIQRQLIHTPLLLLIIYITLVNIINYQNIRFSSYGLSLIFLIYIYSVFLIKDKISIGQTLRVAKLIFYLYVVNILLLFVLYHFNIIDSQIPGASFDFRSGTMRYFGFTSEPSITAFILFSCVYFINKFSPADKAKILFTLYYCLIIFFIKSSYAFMLALILIYSIISKQKLNIKFYFLTMFFLMSFILFAFNSNVYIGRILNFIEFLFKINLLDFEGALYSLDDSIYWRIIPTVNYILSGDFTLLGQGAGTGQHHFMELFSTDVDLEYFGIGLFPNFLYDYGAIGALLFFYFFLYPFVRHGRWITVFILLLLIYNAPFNTNHLWFCWLFLFFSEFGAIKQKINYYYYY